VGKSVLFDAEVDESEDHFVIEVALVSAFLFGIVFAVLNDILPEFSRLLWSELADEGEEAIPGYLEVDELRGPVGGDCGGRSFIEGELFVALVGGWFGGGIPGLLPTHAAPFTYINFDAV
jgi:hypothetical protein